VDEVRVSVVLIHAGKMMPMMMMMMMMMTTMEFGFPVFSFWTV
jgi:hypothetical protein